MLFRIGFMASFHSLYSAWRWHGVCETLQSPFPTSDDMFLSSDNHLHSFSLWQVFQLFWLQNHIEVWALLYSKVHKKGNNLTIPPPQWINFFSCTQLYSLSLTQPDWAITNHIYKEPDWLNWQFIHFKEKADSHFCQAPSISLYSLSLRDSWHYNHFPHQSIKNFLSATIEVTYTQVWNIINQITKAF